MLSGVGLGYRAEIAADLLQNRDRVDFVELVAEAHLRGDAFREAIAISRMLPTVVHGVKLSLGSAEGIDEDRVRAIAHLAKETRAPAVSEHISFCRAAGRDIGHLTALPRTRDAVRAMVKNVNLVRRRLPDVPFYLENVAWSFTWREDEMSEADFICEVVEQTGCPLLLDVGNLFANARNANQPPEALLANYPVERTAMMHIAGGIEEDGFYFDTHAHPVPSALFDLLPRIFERAGDVPVLIERDANFPPFDELVNETDLIRARLSGKATQVQSGPSRSPAEPCSEHLADAQAALARALTDEVNHLESSLLNDQPLALERARQVLRGKRVDDALPLLPTLVRFDAHFRSFAEHVIAKTPRAPERVAIADALAIAYAAGTRPQWKAAAERDATMLVARFATRDGTPIPRRGPYARRLKSGGLILKGFGSDATVRILESR